MPKPASSGHTTSVWMKTAVVPDFPPLRENTTADVCVVGAGISGLTTAYLLARAGKRVVVLDDGPVGGGETGRTTAHITAALDDRYGNIESMHGEEGSRIAAESHRAAIDRIEQIVSAERIDCDFERVDGYLFLGGDDARDVLEKELEAASKAGLTGLEIVPRAPLGSFDTGPALRFPRQAQFHPLKYLAGLAAAIERDGGRIHTRTHVLEVKGGDPAVVTVEGGQTVTARTVVVATNTPVNDRVVIHTKQAAYRSYVIGARVPAGSVPPGLYWDTPDPYHYVRVQRDPEGGHDVLIVGGEDHKTGQEDDAADRFRRLEDWTRERFPSAERAHVRWSGQVMEPVDYMGFIGKNPMDDDNVFVITGDSGNGMTHGTVAGILLTALVQGETHRWSSLYDPSRISLKATPQFLKATLNVVKQYKDLATPGEVSSADDVRPGEGAVIRRGATKIAVYRDPKGVVHERSAICPHLYCVVDWNPAEQSWDCPCHGSRFDAMGKVLNGPAIVDLPPADG